MKYIIVLMLFCGNAYGDSLPILKKIADSLLVVDFLQTHEIASNDKYIEINPLLGKSPSKSKINLYFASVLSLNHFATKYLSRDFQKFIQCGLISIEGSYVLGNASIGVRIYN